MKTITIVSARMESSRLPNKAMLELWGYPMIIFILKRINMSTSSDKTILCATATKPNDILEQVARDNGFDCFREQPGNHVKGKLELAEKENADVIVRVTGDNPFTCPYITDLLIGRQKFHKVDYSRAGDLSAAVRLPGYKALPEGITPEVFTVDALKKVYDHCDDYLDCGNNLTTKFSDIERLGLIKMDILPPPYRLDRPQYRLTVDYMEDYETMRSICKAVGEVKKFDYYNIFDIIKVLDDGLVDIRNEEKVAK